MNYVTQSQFFFKNIYITCFIKHYCFVNFEIYLEFDRHIILNDKLTVGFIFVKFLFIIKYNISIQEINEIHV